MAFEDLLKDSSFPLDNKNYFNLTITDLNISTLFPLQFRWKYEDGSFGPWSAVKSITTPGESFPNVPSNLTVVGGAGFLTVTWDGNNPLFAQLSNVNTYVPVAIGDEIVSTAQSSSYPEGIPIGKIIKIDRDPEKKEYDIKILISTPFSRLKNVYVVTNLLKKEQFNTEYKAKEEGEKQ
jgi:hypothetical protein